MCQQAPLGGQGIANISIAVRADVLTARVHSAAGKTGLGHISL